MSASPLAMLRTALNRAPNLTLPRFASNTASKLTYTEYGDPVKVVHMEREPLPAPAPHQVLVRMLAAPVNPADINTIQGKYPVRPPLPAVPGNEGIGEVAALGAAVPGLAVGDRVVPFGAALGTWRSHLLLPRASLFRVPAALGRVEAATLAVNPCTAYRMLRDFADMRPGDVLIQNGANSACGQSVVQIARAWGLKTVNVVRNRPEIEELRGFLRALGAHHVLTEEELRTTELFKSKQLPKPKLALNCVGGQNALELLRHLENGAPMVTYGGMSREPVTVPTGALIFKNIQVVGFWMTEWVKQNAENCERFEMLDELISMMQSGELQGPSYKMVPFEHFKEALMNTATIKGMTGKKYLLDFEQC